jgi:hypothetical protein
MFRMIRVPAALDNFFQPLERHFHWNHFMYFRVLVVTMAVMWGRRNVATLYRYLDAAPHRTRFNNFFLVERWDPEAVLRQKARALLRALRLGKGDTIYLIVDDSKKAKRGKAMDAIAKMKAPTTEAYIRGHQYVWCHPGLPRLRHPFWHPTLCQKSPLCGLGAYLSQDDRVGSATHSGVQAPRRRQGRGLVRYLLSVSDRREGLSRTAVSFCLHPEEQSEPVQARLEAQGRPLWAQFVPPAPQPIPWISRSPMGQSAIASWMLAGGQQARATACGLLAQGDHPQDPRAGGRRHAALRLRGCCKTLLEVSRGLAKQCSWYHTLTDLMIRCGRDNHEPRL